MQFLALLQSIRVAPLQNEIAAEMFTVRVKLITGSLVTLENLFPKNYRYRYRLEIRMNSFNYHYGCRLGVRSHTFISIDSQLPSWKSFELISPKLPLPLPSWNVFELEGNDFEYDGNSKTKFETKSETKSLKKHPETSPKNVKRCSIA